MDDGDARLPDLDPTPVRAGASLRAAREAQGLSLADVAARTRIPLRHLGAIEEGDYISLPSPTYAVGFARGYARAVGLDEIATAQAVRAEVDSAGPRAPEYVPYEAPDPARVPSRGVAIVALGLALAILILGGLWYGTSMLRGSGDEAAAPTAATPTASPGAPVPAAPRPAAPTGGTVVLTANDDVWMRVYDADNKTLYLGTMKPGETFTVPADAREPMINVGRPDKLAVTIDGKPVPPLGTGQHAIKDVKVGGAAIAARLAGAPAATASPSPTPSSPSSPHPHHSVAAKPHRAAAPIDDTQRANLDAAAHPPAATGNSTTP